MGETDHPFNVLYEDSLSSYESINKGFVRPQLLELVDSLDPLCSTQQGFQKSKSVITNLLVTKKYIAEAYNKEESFDSILIDFKRATIVLTIHFSAKGLLELT